MLARGLGKLQSPLGLLQALLLLNFMGQASQRAPTLFLLCCGLLPARRSESNGADHIATVFEPVLVVEIVVDLTLLPLKLAVSTAGGRSSCCQCGNLN